MQIKTFLAVFALGYITSAWSLLPLVHFIVIDLIGAQYKGLLIQSCLIALIVFGILTYPLYLVAEQEAQKTRYNVRTSAREQLRRRVMSLIKLFWPNVELDATCQQAYLIGWNVRGFSACVAAIVPHTPLEDLERVLAKVGKDHVQQLGFSKAVPMVLGVIMFGMDGATMDKEIAIRRQNATFWLTVHAQQPHGMPVVSSLYCCGVRYGQSACQFIFYHQPNRKKRHVLTMYPLKLHSSHEQHTQLGHLNGLTRHNVAKTWMIAKEHKSTTADDNELLLLQVNTSQLLCDLLVQNDMRVLTQTGGGWWFGRWLMQAMTLVTSFLRLLVHKPTAYIIALVMFTVTYTSKYILRLLYMPIGGQKTNLKRLSSTAQQLSLRIKQISTWPQHLKTSKQDLASSSLFHISFYNVLWLIINDVSMGILLGWTLILSRHAFADTFWNIVHYYTFERIHEQIIWLMGWPSGLKLNDDLDVFLGEMFLWLLSVWNEYAKFLAGHVHIYIALVGCCGAFGASMIFSIVNDTIFFLTLHLHWFYVIMSRVYHLHVIVLRSLFNLLRGKKNNVLRHRIDQADFSLDQLLLGTIMFTLLTFLLPTVAVYYGTFAAVRLAILTLNAMTDMVLTSLNNFPLYPLLLRVMDPDGLPGGVVVECKGRHPSMEVIYLSIKSRPLSISLILADYFYLLGRTLRHYLSFSNAWRLVVGDLLQPAQPIYYSRLPSERLGHNEYWRHLKKVLGI